MCKRTFVSECRTLGFVDILGVLLIIKRHIHFLYYLFNFWSVSETSFSTVSLALSNKGES